MVSKATVIAFRAVAGLRELGSGSDFEQVIRDIDGLSSDSVCFLKRKYVSEYLVSDYDSSSVATRLTFMLASLAAFPLFLKSFLPSRDHHPTNIESMGKRKLGQACLPGDGCHPSSVKIHPSTLTPQQLWDQHISTRTPAIIQGLPNDAEFKADRWTASSLIERAVRSGSGLLGVAACASASSLHTRPYSDYQLAARSWRMWKQKAYTAVDGGRRPYLAQTVACRCLNSVGFNGCREMHKCWWRQGMQGQGEPLARVTSI